MSLYDRLNLNFDTSRFGNAQNLSSNAANTLGLISNTTNSLTPWQINDISSGPPVRTNYFQNPTTTYLTTMLSAANTIYVTANTIGDNNTSLAASSLMIEIQSFQSHTDNISGVVSVSNTYFPSLQSAGNMGQLNMITLTSTDNVSNTVPILGSFTSLFITDLLQANANVIITYANQYANSVANISGNLVSNLSNSQINTIDSYLSNTQNLMMTRRTGDWSFYQNSMQLAQDVSFMQQFNNMGGTMTYLVNNVVGTPNLLNNLNGS
jgi:hypothetical protein